MNQVPPYSLWIGHAGDSTLYGKILDTGIQAIVQLAAEEPSLQAPRDLIVCRFPLLDGTGNDRKLLSLAVMTVANLLESNVSTLVCCSAGMSRAPAVAAAAISMVYQEKPDDCLKQVAEHRPHDVTPGFWAELKAMLDATRT
ncbi:MAG: hypothetical protein K2R98_16890 [Gemmataceae bacterium]|nr:hypothetical protein [Gemmataceae bacterium]